MYRRNNTPTTDVEIPTTTLYVPRVVERATCEKHEAALGVPCHQFESIISDNVIGGICNSRARKAGMNAPIRRQSLTVSLSGQPYRGRR